MGSYKIQKKKKKKKYKEVSFGMSSERVEVDITVTPVLLRSRIPDRTRNVLQIVVENGDG